MKVRDITSLIESLAPLPYQESYDNAGLVVGDPEQDLQAVLLSLDVNEKVVEESSRLGANLIISHHPVIFDGLKSLTGRTGAERAIIRAIRNNISICSAHTNLDNVLGGVNSKIAEKIGLINTRILKPRPGELRKLVTFAPTGKAEDIRNAIFDAGAGNIGNYDRCSFNLEGKGTFRGGEGTDPYLGQEGKLHFADEIRIETIFPKHIEGKVIRALLEAHPYEEVAYDIYPLENRFDQVGMGMIGELEKPVDEIRFLEKLKDLFHATMLRHTPLLGRKVRKAALCGGSGSFLVKDAISSGADIFISGDFRYHQFFDAENKIVIADIGHYESEQFTLEIFYEALTKKFPKFAVHFSDVNTNPINYL